MPHAESGSAELSRDRPPVPSQRVTHPVLAQNSFNHLNCYKKSPTHKVDCYKNRVALELEWNNKDPFFDRDLNNFRLLFDLRAISAGIIITRTDELQNVFDGLYDASGRCIGPKYGPSTTHMGKLLPRIQGGGGGGCPILVFGIKPSLYVEEM